MGGMPGCRVTACNATVACADPSSPTSTSTRPWAGTPPRRTGTVCGGRRAEMGIRHLPVVDGHQLVGMLSMRDLLAEQATPAAPD
jgi:CBS domain-containing protein